MLRTMCFSESTQKFSQAHRPGSFEKKRRLSIFHGFGIQNGVLKTTQLTDF